MLIPGYSNLTGTCPCPCLIDSTMSEEQEHGDVILCLTEISFVQLLSRYDDSGFSTVVDIATSARINVHVREFSSSRPPVWEAFVLDTIHSKPLHSPTIPAASRFVGRKCYCSPRANLFSTRSDNRPTFRLLSEDLV